MNLTETLRLLILNDSSSEVERLLSMFRNAGLSARTQHATSMEALSKLLQEQTWDLLIGHDATTDLPVNQAMKEISRLNKDIPVILITESEDSRTTIDGMRAGAADVVKLDDDQHLILVIRREMRNREHRQSQRVAERRRLEAETRALELLGSCKKAIAYVQEGMFVYVNETWGEILQFDDIDELTVMPLIDLVAEKDQGSIKSALKKFNALNVEPEPEILSVHFVTAQEQEIELSIEVSLGSFDNEKCLLVQCNPGKLTSPPVASTSQAGQSDETQSQGKLRDSNTGLPNRTAIYQQLEKCLDDSASNGSSHAFFLLEIAEFEHRVIATLGYRLADQAIKELANLVNDQLEDAYLGRFGDSALGVVLSNCSASTAQQQARALVDFVAEQIIEVKTNTVHIRPHIGISLITETIQTSDDITKHARLAVDTLRELDEKSEGGYHLFELPEQEISAEESMTSALESALENELLHLVFQPIIGLRGSGEEQYEVMVRIQDDTGQQVPTQDLFHNVDDLNLLSKLDRWVVLTAAKKLSEQRARGHVTRLWVNLSQAAFYDDNLPSWLKVALKAAELPADAMIFQVKESDVADHISKAKNFTDAVKENGTPVSITNFGCILDPLNTLKHIPVDFIKLDGSYTKELQENPRSSGLTNLVKELNELKKITIVPFVENASALSKLWQAGVHYIQGYYLQEPNSSMNYDFDSDT